MCRNQCDSVQSKIKAACVYLCTCVGRTAVGSFASRCAPIPAPKYGVLQEPAAVVVEQSFRGPGCAKLAHNYFTHFRTYMLPAGRDNCREIAIYPSDLNKP